MEFADGLTVGIDLGTSNSAIAYLNADGEPVLLPDESGYDITPSIVRFTGGQDVEVGHLDPDDIADPDDVLVAVKRQMGTQDVVREVDGQQLRPEFISALILRKLKQAAEANIGPVANAVISVPYYFNDPCRRATRDAGEIAGLNVVDIINEPTAATLAYAWICGELGRTEVFSSEKKILVYDLGGGTFDATLVRYTPTDFQVIGTDGDTFLGGLDWTKRIVDIVSDKFIQRFDVDPRDDPYVMLHLTAQCDVAKHELSVKQSTSVTLYYDDTELNVSISRKDFHQRTADLLQRTRDTVELLLANCQTDVSELHETILIGGSTAIPAVSDMLEEVTGRRPSTRLDPERAVAQGAAVHAAILEARYRKESTVADSLLKRLRSVRAEDVNSHSLGIELTDPTDRTQKTNHIMIPRNSQLPSNKRQRFKTNKANPEGIRIRLLEGESSEASACTVVGECRITGLPQDLPAGSPVEVTYQYDVNRHINVYAKELTGGNEASVRIVWDSADSLTSAEDLQQVADAYAVH
jgi:molecular chaperone DnaK